jgi:molecular chaperone DnaK (HSP70)
MQLVSIDLGTCNTVICALDTKSNQVKNLTFKDLSQQLDAVSVVPSIVWVESPQCLLIGQAAQKIPNKYNSPRLFTSFKRDLSATYRPPDRQIDSTNFSSETIAKNFIQQIWQQVIQQISSPSQLVFSLPLNGFNIYQNWFLQLEKTLNLPPVKLIDEASAAAWGYGIYSGGIVVLMVNFGLSTLELTLFRTAALSPGQKILQAEVLGSLEAYIGGVDLDISIAKYFLQTLGLSRNNLSRKNWQKLLELAENCKITLSTHPEVTVSWENEEQIHSFTLNQATFTQILHQDGHLEEIQRGVEELLTIGLNRGINESNIAHILLIGGNCAINAIQQLFIQQFSPEKLKLAQPLTAIAEGGLRFGERVGIRESLPHSYAIRLWDTISQSYFYYFLFETGSTYPSQQPKTLTLQAVRDKQEEIWLDIGEIREVSAVEVAYNAQGQIISNPLLQQREFRPLQLENQSLRLPLLPPGQTQVDRLQLQVDLNQQQILSLTVRDLLTQRILLNKVDLNANPHQSRLEGAVLESPILGMVNVGVLGGLIGKKRQLGIEDLSLSSPNLEFIPINWDSLTCLYHIQGYCQGVTSVAISPDGTILATGTQDHEIRLWNLATGRPLAVLTAHQGGVTSLAISPDGKLLASGSQDKTFRFWHLRSGQLLRTFSEHQAPVFSVAFSADGAYFASSGWQPQIILRQLSGVGNTRYLPGHRGGVTAIAFSPDGQLLVSSGDNTLKVWQVTSGELLHTFSGHTDLVLTIAINQNGQLLASSAGMSDRKVKLWHLGTGEYIQTLSGHQGDILSLAFSQDGTALIGGGFRYIYIWDLSAGNLIHSLAAHEKEVTSLAFSPEGKRLVTGSSDKTVKVFSLS